MRIRLVGGPKNGELIDVEEGRYTIRFPYLPESESERLRYCPAREPARNIQIDHLTYRYVGPTLYEKANPTHPLLFYFQPKG